MYPVEQLNYLLALGTLVLQVLSVAFFAAYFLRKRIPGLEDVATFIGRWGLWAGFLFTIVGIATSLFYSEVLGITACGWCWVQRVFFWPQAVLFAIALWKNDRDVADYSIGFSILGALVGLYQHYLQMGGTSVIPCPATASQAVDCAVRFMFEFGYITYPLMTATGFGFLIVLMLFVRRRSNG